jgi:hypothetical protein
MVRKNGNSSEITTWLLRSAVGLACFLAHEQLAEIKSFIIEVRSESKTTISNIATLQEKVSNIESEIRQRRLP